jgi:hypothetical protein
VAKRIAFNESASQIKLCSGAVTLQPRGEAGDHAELTEDQVKHGTVVLMERARKISVLTADEAAARLKKSKPAEKKKEAAPKKAEKKDEPKAEPKAEPKEPEPAPEPPPAEPPPSTEKTEEKADIDVDEDEDDEKKPAFKRSKKKKSRRG